MKPNTHTIVHGGDLVAIRQRFPTAPTPWIDLSTGINPVAYPTGTIGNEAWQRLPGRADEAALIAAAAMRFGIAEPATIVAAPGTQALIQLLPRLVPGRRVAVVGPTYEEHQVSWRRAGREVRIVETIGDTAGSDIVVVVNPDNPTGRLYTPEELRTVKTTLIVDEAFIDFLPPDASIARDLPANVVVLRSFGKAYGLAGLRLGFVVAPTDLAARLREELGPWAVSGPALAIGRAALADTAWLEGTAARLERDCRRLDGMLAAAGCAPVGGTLLFRTVRHDDAAGLVERLGRHGIHVRAFPAAPDRLRFGLPGSDTEFRRLAAALGI